MKIALIQQKATEDTEANYKNALESVDRAAEQGAQVICFVQSLLLCRFTRRSQQKGL